MNGSDGTSKRGIMSWEICRDRNLLDDVMKHLDSIYRGRFLGLSFKLIGATMIIHSIW